MSCDTVREARGRTGFVGDVLVHSYGTSSEVPVGQVPRYWMEEELHSVGKVRKLCRVKIYSNSRVLGHGQFVLSHTI